MASSSQQVPSVSARPSRRRPSVFQRYPVVPLLIILLVLVIPALFAEAVAPHNPFQGSLGQRLRPPAFLGGPSAHLLGTDAQGRDILSRVIYGARVSAIVAAAGIFIGGVVGVTLGLVAGYFGGWSDAIISRLAEVTMSVPIILVAIVLATAIGASFTSVVIIVALYLWSVYARQTRAETLKWRESLFVKRARVVGCSNARILFRHILPNMVNTLIVLVTLQVGFVIVFEASLSFVGVGIPRPNPAWGLMVSEGREFVLSAWWVPFFPGAAIVLTVLAFNLLGDWLRDHLDPRLRQV
jgi:peptide/nickel transport system permease protein